MVTCKKCGEETDELAVFPGGICLSCYEKKMEGQPLEKPDFIRTINWK